MANNSAAVVPDEFFSTKTLFTLSGSAAAVWLFCLVLSALIPPNALSVYYWRLIAFLCSEFLAIVIILKQDINKLDKWVLGLLNGLLIFINASGINAVSTGLAFEDKNALKSTKISLNLKTEHRQNATFFLFSNEINWWPDQKIVAKNDSLSSINNNLTLQVQNLKVKYNGLASQYANTKPSGEPVPDSATESDNRMLRLANGRLKYEMLALQQENNVLKKTNAAMLSAVKENPRRQTNDDVINTYDLETKKTIASLSS